MATKNCQGPTLDISVDYLCKEERRGRYVWDWIRKYSRANGIKTETLENKRGEPFQFRLCFKSRNQLDWFVRAGNRRFPYFEFQ